MPIPDRSQLILSDQNINSIELLLQTYQQHLKEEGQLLETLNKTNE